MTKKLTDLKVTHYELMSDVIESHRGEYGRVTEIVLNPAALHLFQQAIMSDSDNQCTPIIYIHVLIAV